MKQILQKLKNGKFELAEVPLPIIKENHVLIESIYSLISPGTEKMINDFAKSNLIKKALSQPDKVNQAINKVKLDGVIPTYEAIKNKLEEFSKIGYCNFGIVRDTNCSEFSIGDRVISNGPHSEYVVVPKNLCAKVPDEVTDETAVFTVLASIALQGVRISQPTLGENYIVWGMGLVGILAYQILESNGCNVVGIEVNASRIKKLQKINYKLINPLNITDLNFHLQNYFNGESVDSVLISTSSNDNSIINSAAKILRKKGRIVLIGTSGLKIERDEFYKKELLFQVSSSYGPGRYDYQYEQKGQDYPISYVRWTEKRNFKAVLKLMQNNKINVKNLINNSFTLEEFEKAFKASQIPDNFSVIIKYKKNKKFHKLANIIKNDFDNISNNYNASKPKLGFIGAGNYAKKILIPKFKKFNTDFISVASAEGINAYDISKNFKFKEYTSNYKNILKNKNIDTVIISTPHDTHTEIVIDSLKKGKNVFVEKPLATNIKQVKIFSEFINSLNQNNTTIPILTIGFNRRFASIIKKVKAYLADTEPKNIIYTVNAGTLDSANNWIGDIDKSGNRIIGEICHFLDLVKYIIGSEIDHYKITSSDYKDKSDDLNNSFVITIKFLNNSIATINYLTNGNLNYSKEKIEIFYNKSIIFIDNFKKLKTFNTNGLNNITLFNQDKGHDNMINEFLNSLKNHKPIIPYNEIIEISKLSIDISNQLYTK